MSCAEFEERVARYVGGDPAPEQSTAVEQHLRACRDCAELARELEADREWLASRPPEIADIDFAAMRREIRREIARPRWGWRWIAVTAAIVLTVGLTITMRRPLPPVAARKEVVVGKEFVERKERTGLSIQSGHTGRRETLAPAAVRRTPAAAARPNLPVEEPQSPVEIRIATRDPNVTIILLHETREVLQ